MQAAGSNGGVILDFTPDTAPSLLNAAVAQGLVDQGEVGLVDADRQHVHGEQEKAFDGKMYINSEIALLTSKGPDETLYNQINGEVRAEDRDPELRPVRLPGCEVRDAGAAQHQGPGHGEVVQPGRART